MERDQRRKRLAGSCSRATPKIVTRTAEAAVTDAALGPACDAPLKQTHLLTCLSMLHKQGTASNFLLLLLVAFQLKLSIQLEGGE